MSFPGCLAPAEEFVGVDNPTLATRTTQAQTALHNLRTGALAVTVTVSGGGQHREVTFTKTEEARLLDYVRICIREQVRRGMMPSTNYRRRSAIGLRF